MILCIVWMAISFTWGVTGLIKLVNNKGFTILNAMTAVLGITGLALWGVRLMLQMY